MFITRRSLKYTLKEDNISQAFINIGIGADVHILSIYEEDFLSA